jgi:hypothetical protein
VRGRADVMTTANDCEEGFPAFGICVASVPNVRARSARERAGEEGATVRGKEQRRGHGLHWLDRRLQRLPHETLWLELSAKASASCC